MTKPLRIGIVCYPTVGGSGVVATEMAMELGRRGHQVHLLSYARPHRLQRGRGHGVRYHGVEVSAYPLFRYPPYDLALATRMLEVQEEVGLDLFHVHYAIPHAVSAFLAREMSGDKIRFVTTLHGTDITVVGSDRAYMRPTRFALEQSNAVTSVSQFLADETDLLFGVQTPIEVIPNFIDPERYQPGKLGHAPNRTESPFQDFDPAIPLVVHASNFRPVKRVADTVRAFAVLRRQMPANLLLIGDGPDREHALAVAEDAGCASSVHHVGALDSTEAVFRDADLLLLSSETESFGLVVLEAMACGVPAVCTKVGGLPEVLTEDCGVLTPPGDPEAMGNAAAAILSDPKRHAAMSAAARARALNEFGQATVIDRYEQLYRRVIE